MRLAPATLTALRPAAAGAGGEMSYHECNASLPRPALEIQDVTESGVRGGGLFLNYFCLCHDVDS